MTDNKTILLSAVLLLAAAGAARAAQFHVPFHVPPHPEFPGAEKRAGFYLEVGAAAFKSRGMEISGPGGCFELSGLGEGSAGVSARGCGFSLSGDVDPLRLGRNGGGGFAGAAEADLLWAPRAGGPRFYAGGLVGLSSLDIRDPLSYTLQNGKLVVEPDTAFSLFLGLPLGAELPLPLSENWGASLQADAVLFPAGVTFFTYMGLPGSQLYGDTRSISAQFSGGARLALFYIPWRLFLEGAGRAYTGGGGNEASSFLSLLGGVRF